MAIEKIVAYTLELFGSAAYKNYTFLLQDSSYGALEHLSSVTLGLPSYQLTKYFPAYILEIAHEYFHAWNLVSIHPAEWTDISYKTPALSRVLWFSEGFTMLYADLLIRRAGLPSEDSNRIKHLEEKIQSYYQNSGNYLFSPEVISMAENAPPGITGDYVGSPHIQGELIGTFLDLYIRSFTGNLKSLDNVMRYIYERYRGKGISGIDIESAINKICGCDVHTFFEENIRGKKELDFNKYLNLIGLHLELSWKDFVDSGGHQRPDLRIYTYNKSPGKLSLVLIDPLSCWGRAGLHTNDIIVSINGSIITNQNDFRSIIQRLQIGDSVYMEILHNNLLLKKQVIISGYKIPDVRLSKIKNTRPVQRKLLEDWFEGR